jgi:hypothetical protein
MALTLLTLFSASASAAPGAPQISEVRAIDVDQTSATLEAKINPGGFPTSYRLEWGPTSAYGRIVPAEFSPFAGEGENAVRVSAAISGISAARTYHYRFAARSDGGVTSTPDQTVETLDSCGLPAGRCFELVSPQEVGLVATPGQVDVFNESLFQADTSGPGALDYVVQTGLPDATTGSQVLYQATRGPDGWSSRQLSPALKERNETTGGGAVPSMTLANSEDLSCSVLTSTQLLTEDPATRPVVEAGGVNFYRRNADGTYSTISYLAPSNLDQGSRGLGGEYELTGMSDGCTKVAFSSERTYPGILGAGPERLYEWQEGSLRNVGVVPGPGGEEVVEAVRVPESVSADGSKVFFGAERQIGHNPGEEHTTGVFARLDGSETLDLSLSETSTPDTGATYQYATRSGSRVYFTANAGLTLESSNEGTDLYEYDFEKTEHRLSDLSVTHEALGAAVAGVLGASADGSVVYFAARGQLIPGKGRTFFENLIAGTYSIYVHSGSGVDYVGQVSAADLPHVLVPTQIGTGAEQSTGSKWSTWVSPDGRYLLFESSANVTGYQSGGAPEAYLFDSDAADSEPIVCVSCRQDGDPSVGSAADLPLPSAAVNSQLYVLHGPQPLVEHAGEVRVFFTSRDILAPGGAEGNLNLYEWAHGQVARLATGTAAGFADGSPLRFAGASVDGSDVYFATPVSLTWEDRDERSSVYDARIDGGFAEPPAPPAPCDPNGEGSCQGASSSPPGAAAVSSATFTGPGNVKPRKCKKGFVARHGGCVKKHAKKKAGHKNKRHAHKKRGGGKHKRPAEADRRAGK